MAFIRHELKTKDPNTKDPSTETQRLQAQKHKGSRHRGPNRGYNTGYDEEPNCGNSTFTEVKS